jgi:hypothetical protein
MSATSTTLVEVTTIHLTTSIENSSYVSSNTSVEKERATLRFAAAQKLFNDQAASQAKPQIPASLSRKRTNTAASLYTKLDASVADRSSLVEQPGVFSSPTDLSFRDAFIKTGARHIPKPATAASLAASQSPPTPVDEGCILLGPRRTLNPFDVTRQIHAATTDGSPAWYCRHDKLVIFDGIRDNSGNGTSKLITRSSRGLDMARRNCPKTTIQVDIPCSHCQDLLKRKTWVFAERMLECRVCKTCQDRCWREWDKRNRSLQPTGDAVDASSPVSPCPLAAEVTVDTERANTDLGVRDTKPPELSGVTISDPDPQQPTG